MDTTLETTPKDATPVFQAAVFSHFRLSSGLGDI
jgi:hypothetical protein